MDIQVSVAGADAADQLRNLYGWLMREPEFAGALQLHERDAEPGELGPVTDLVQAALEPGGAVSAFAAVVIAWLKFRTSDVKITVSRPAGEPHVELDARRIRELDAAATQALTDELAQTLQSGDGNASQ